MRSQNPKSNKQRKGTLSLRRPSKGEGSSEPLHVPVIDLEENDDNDVIETSPRAFAEAVAKARRTSIKTEVLQDMENRSTSTFFKPDGSLINPTEDIIINFKEGMFDDAPEPPIESVFDCPLCMGPFVEETTTRCGHIFCKECIKLAISSQAQCPLCLAKVTKRSLIRVFLPTPKRRNI